MLDTNSYRSLGQADFRAILIAERSRGVLGVANVSVLEELLSHVRDESDEEFGKCLAALKRMAEHCLEYRDGGLTLRMLARGAHQVRFSLTGTRTVWPDEMTAYAELLQSVVEGPRGVYARDVREQLETVAAHAEKVKQGFVDAMWRLVQHWQPDATSWRSIQGNAELRRQLDEELFTEDHLHLFARLFAEAFLSRDEMDSREAIASVSERALDLFPTGVRYLRGVVRGIAERGTDISKRDNRNGMYDLIIAASTGGSARMFDLPVWFVTTDAQVLRAAEAAGERHVFRSLQEYRALLNESTDVFIDAIEENASRDPLNSAARTHGL